MKTFIFKDKNLEAGYLIADGASKEINLSSLKDYKEVLFVLPNEILSFITHTHEYKNRANLHASIINSSNTIEISNQTKQKVLETKKNDQYFFIINDENTKFLKEKFSRADIKIKVTSDLLFFTELFDFTIRFGRSIFYKDVNDLVKLTEQSYKLLDDGPGKVVDKSVEDICLSDLSDIDYHEFDLFNVKNVFNYQSMKYYIFASVSMILLLNIIGLVNMYSNSKQVNDMDNMLTDLYVSMYPEDQQIDSIVNQINDRYNSTFEINNNHLANKITNLILNMPKKSKILQITLNNSDSKSLLIRCLFDNKAEELSFIRNQEQNNNNISIVSTLNENNILITEFIYEL
tara:strand:- start:147 stop:1184 length:1038 start_codon:yes stop_codon:yes gene_type:complete